MKIFAISPDTLSRIEIDFAVALIAPRSIEYSPLFRTRIYRTDRQDAREEAEHEKSPIVNHRVTLCVYSSCTSRLTGISLFSLPPHVYYSRNEKKKNNTNKCDRKCVLFVCALIYILKIILISEYTYNVAHIFIMK